jgi:hypothetical protein
MIIRSKNINLQGIENNNNFKSLKIYNLLEILIDQKLKKMEMKAYMLNH